MRGTGPGTRVVWGGGAFRDIIGSGVEFKDRSYLLI